MGMASAVGGILQAYSSLRGAESQQSYSNYLAGLSEQQAGMVELQGEKQITDVMDIAADQSAQLSRQSKQTSASQRAAMAANGVGAGSATSEDVSYDTQIKSEEDQRNLYKNAQTKSSEIRYSTDIEAANLRNQANSQRIQGMYSKAAGYTNVASSLLNSATQVATMWSAYGDTGKKTTSKFWFGV